MPHQQQMPDVEHEDNEWQRCSEDATALPPLPDDPAIGAHSAAPPQLFEIVKHLKARDTDVNAWEAQRSSESTDPLCRCSRQS